MIKRSEMLYVNDILEAIKHIEIYTKKVSFKRFSTNQMMIDAVIRNFEIIGEASQKLSKKTKSTVTSVPWRDVVDMRNKIIHEYFGVDLEIIWETIKVSLPEFKKAIQKIKF